MMPTDDVFVGDDAWRTGFRNRLREIVDEQGSQTAAAAAMGLSPKTLNDWLNSPGTNPGILMIYNAAQSLGRPVEWLAFGTQIPHAGRGLSNEQLGVALRSHLIARLVASGIDCEAASALISPPKFVLENVVDLYQRQFGQLERRARMSGDRKLIEEYQAQKHSSDESRAANAEMIRLLHARLQHMIDGGDFYELPGHATPKNKAAAGTAGSVMKVSSSYDWVVAVGYDGSVDRYHPVRSEPNPKHRKR